MSELDKTSPQYTLESSIMTTIIQQLKERLEEKGAIIIYEYLSLHDIHKLRIILFDHLISFAYSASGWSDAKEDSIITIFEGLENGRLLLSQPINASVFLEGLDGFVHALQTTD